MIRIQHLIPPAAVAAAAVIVHAANPTVPGGIIPTCPSKALFGVCCPLCGSTRMVDALTHGDIAAAVHYNAVVLVFGLLLVWSWIAWIGRDHGKRWYGIEHWKAGTIISLVVLGVWGVIRNLPFEPFASLWV